MGENKVVIKEEIIINFTCVIYTDYIFLNLICLINVDFVITVL